MHRAEEVALVLEVVVERPARDGGSLHDLLGADGGVAASGEQLAGGGEQRGARALRLSCAGTDLAWLHC